MKASISLLALLSFVCSAGFSAEMRGNIGQSDLKGMMVSNISVKSDSTKVIVTLNEFGGIPYPPNPNPIPVPPPGPDAKHRSNSYNLELDTSDAVDAVAYQAFLRSVGNWSTVDVSFASGGQIASIDINGAGNVSPYVPGPVVTRGKIGQSDLKGMVVSRICIKADTKTVMVSLEDFGGSPFPNIIHYQPGKKDVRSNTTVLELNTADASDMSSYQAFLKAIGNWSTVDVSLANGEITSVDVHGFGPVIWKAVVYTEVDSHGIVHQRVQYIPEFIIPGPTPHY